MGTARVAGIVMATQAAYLPTENLAVALVDSIVKEQKILLQDLRVGVAARFEDYTDDMEYFGNISTINARFTVYIPTAGVLEDRGLPLNLEKLHLKPVFVLPFFVCFCCGCCGLWRKSKKKDSATHFDGQTEQGTDPKCSNTTKHLFSCIVQPSFTSRESEDIRTSLGCLRRKDSSRSLDGLPRQESLRSTGERSLCRQGSSHSLRSPHRQILSKLYATPLSKRKIC